MSAARVERALLHLNAEGAVLARLRAGKGFGVYANGDRRRRPLGRISEAEVRELEASGAVEARGDAFVLSAAGRARVRRGAARPEEAFAAQHRPVVDRAVMDGDGDVRRVRGHEADLLIRRLAALRDVNGAMWLSGAELAAGSRLRSDWERGQLGLVRGSDWSAPPQGGAARGPGNALENAMGAHCDARRRVEETLGRLAPALRRVVEHVCLREDGIEALERLEKWPARSGKIALKLALAQLAEG